MAHDDIPCNPSGNRPFHEILENRLSRRQLLTGSLALAAASFFSGCSNPNKSKPTSNSTLMSFRPVSIADGSGPWPSISADYQYDILIPWGTAIQATGPEFRWPARAEDQIQQVGIGHDGMRFFAINQSNDHGMLAINHEFGRNSHVLGKKKPESLEEVRASQHAHGVSILEMKKVNQRWQVQNSTSARRIHANTAMEFSGPAAAHLLLQTPAANPPRGTFNNCSSGYTPWGTYLTCEENVNGYFGANKPWSANEAQARYGFSQKGSGYNWYQFDPRFDLSDEDYKNEENRFGWVVEIDPFDATQTPVKRTAMGRFKHEGVALTVGKDGRVVAYMGDDQRFDYIYKFVSDDNWQTMRERGQSPLDHGALFVARFNDDGSGDWLELSIDNPKLAKRFKDQGEILIYTRLAADILGATPMDRPEWTTVAPNGEVYLTNNVKRLKTNAANPHIANLSGHIIKWRDQNKHIDETFQWEIFLIAKDSHDKEHSFSSPDGLWADPDGRLFIQTDGYQQQGLNNQLLVADTNSGEIRRLFTGVTDCEITGITHTPDRRNLFINIQHPGKGDPTKSNFPLPFDGKSIPRDATIVISRKDGGIVGS
jgi:secreted PhoX family phosphatase